MMKLADCDKDNEESKSEDSFIYNDKTVSA